MDNRLVQLLVSHGIYSMAGWWESRSEKCILLRFSVVFRLHSCRFARYYSSRQNIFYIIMSEPSPKSTKENSAWKPCDQRNRPFSSDVKYISSPDVDWRSIEPAPSTEKASSKQGKHPWHYAGRMNKVSRVQLCETFSCNIGNFPIFTRITCLGRLSTWEIGRRAVYPNPPT